MPSRPVIRLDRLLDLVVAKPRPTQSSFYDGRFNEAQRPENPLRQQRVGILVNFSQAPSVRVFSAYRERKADQLDSKRFLVRYSSSFVLKANRP